MNAKTYLLSGLALAMLAACNKNEVEVPGEVTVEVSEIRLPSDASSSQTPTTTTFIASQPWRIETSATKSDAADWMHVAPMSGEAGAATLTITADENPSAMDRTAYIRIVCGGVTRDIAVTQPGDGTLVAGETIYQVGPQADTVIVQLRSGASYQVDVPEGSEWIRSEFLSHGPKVDSLALILSANPAETERTGAIRIAASSGGFQAEIAMFQRSGVLDLQFELDQLVLPTGRSSSESSAQWVDSLFVAGFDREGEVLFAQSLPRPTESDLHIRVLPPAERIRNTYPEARIYVVANSSADLNRWPENETQWINGKDTAVNRLFGADEVQPPLSARVTQNLVAGENRVQVGLSHVTAIVTFKVRFDEGWDSIPPIEQITISGFSNWGYLFPNATEQAVPQTIGYNPAVEPNGTNDYRFYAYENSRLVLTVLAGGRYYQGIAPNILKRGYNYSFNMRVCEDGNCVPAAADE